MTRARSCALTIVVAVVGAGLVLGPAAPSSAATLSVSSYGDLVSALSAGSSTIQLHGTTIGSPNGSTLAVAPGQTVNLDLNGVYLSAVLPAAGSAGINVPATSTLNILDSAGGGRLLVQGGPSAAGIGGNYLQAAGTVTISGGWVQATGGTAAAGIGAGYQGAPGSVSISGGRVDAVGSANAAGIGGGQTGDGGTVTISGGTVNATSPGPGPTGAGIGGGYTGGGATVLITGGTVNAIGVNGIGTGSNALSGTSPGSLTVGGSASPASTATDGSPDVNVTTATPLVSTGLPSRYLYTATSTGPGRLGITFSWPVTFDSAGGTAAPSDQLVAAGGLATKPTPPTRSGYTFAGWHVGSAMGSLFDFATPVAVPIDLIAQWTDLTPTIAPSGPVSATMGVPFDFTPTAGGTGLVFTSTTLPSGLTVNVSTGVISGTPTGPIGGSDVLLTATNTTAAATLALHIDVLVGAPVGLVVTPSSSTPNQGDTVAFTVVAADAYGNHWDVTPTVVLTSSVASDRITGNAVTFVRASLHTITARDTASGMTASVLIQVMPVASVLASTGTSTANGEMLFALALLAAGGAMMAGGWSRRRSAR